MGAGAQLRELLEGALREHCDDEMGAHGRHEAIGGGVEERQGLRQGGRLRAEDAGAPPCCVLDTVAMHGAWRPDKVHRQSCRDQRVAATDSPV